MIGSESATALVALSARLVRDADAASDVELRAAFLLDAARASHLAGDSAEASRLCANLLAMPSPTSWAALLWAELSEPGWTPWSAAHSLLRANSHARNCDVEAGELLASCRQLDGSLSASQLGQFADRTDDNFTRHMLWCAAIGGAAPEDRAALVAQRLRTCSANERGAVELQLARSLWGSGGASALLAPDFQTPAVKSAWARAVLRHSECPPESAAVAHAQLAFALEGVGDLGSDASAAEHAYLHFRTALQFALAGDSQGCARALLEAAPHAAQSDSARALGDFLWRLLLPAERSVDGLVHTQERSAVRLEALQAYLERDADRLREAIRAALEGGHWDSAMGRMELALWGGYTGDDLSAALHRAVAGTGIQSERDALVAYAVCIFAGGGGRSEDIQSARALCASHPSPLVLEAVRAAAVGLGDRALFPCSFEDEARALYECFSSVSERRHAMAELEQNPAWAWAVSAASWVESEPDSTSRAQLLSERTMRAATSASEKQWTFDWGLRHLSAETLWSWLEHALEGALSAELLAEAKFVRALTLGRMDLGAERALVWAQRSDKPEVKARALLAAAYCDAEQRPERATQSALESAALCTELRTEALSMAIAAGGALRGATPADADAPTMGRIALAQLRQGLVAEAKANLALASQCESPPGAPLAAALISAMTLGPRLLDGQPEAEAVVHALRRCGGRELVAVLRRASSRGPSAIAAAAGLFAQRPSSATWLDWTSSALQHKDSESLADALQATAVLEGVAPTLAESMGHLAVDYLGPPTSSAKRTSTAWLQLDASPPGSDPAVRAEALLATAGSSAEEQLDTLALAAWNQFAAGDALASREAFKAVTQARPEDVAAWEGLRRSAIAMDDANGERDATMALAVRVKLKTRKGVLCFRAHELELLRGDKVSADRWLREALEHCPGQDEWALRWLNTADAPDQLERAAMLVAQEGRPMARAEAHWLLARRHRETGDSERALAELDSLLAISPAHAGALALRADMLLKLGRYEEATAPLELIFSSEHLPDTHRIMAAVGLAETLGKKLSRPAEALTLLEAAHARFPEALGLVEGMARYASELGKSQLAIEGFTQVALRVPDARRRARAARLVLELHRERGESGPLEMLIALADAEPTDALHVANVVQELSNTKGAADDAPHRMRSALAFFEQLRRRLPELVQNDAMLRHYAQLAELLGRLPELHAAQRVLRAMAPHSMPDGAPFDRARVEHAVTHVLSSSPRGESPKLPNLRQLKVQARDRLRMDGGPWSEGLSVLSAAFGLRVADAYMVSSRSKAPVLGWDLGPIWVLPLVDSLEEAQQWTGYLLYLLGLSQGLAEDDAARLAVLATDEATVGAQLNRAHEHRSATNSAKVYGYVLGDEFYADRARLHAAISSPPPSFPPTSETLL